MNKQTDIVELTTEQLEDYVSCPNKFYLTYVKGIRSRHKSDIKEILENVRDNIMYTLMEGKIPTKTKLNNLYNKLLIEKHCKMDADSVLKGAAWVNILHNWCCTQMLRIADIGTPFELVFPNSNTL